MSEMNLFAKKNQNKSGTPPPPEPEFFDSEDRKTKGLIRGFFEKWWLSIVLIAGALLLLSVIFIYLRFDHKTKEPLIGIDEKRILTTPSSMENAIDSGKGKKVKALPQQTDAGVRDKKQKRKYDTRIAVFVAEPEKSKEIGNPPKSERQKQVKLGLPSGTKITALISNRIFSFNVAAPVTAVVTKDFMWKDKVVIPKGSQFLGEVNILKSLDRINVRFDLLIVPDGREIRIKAMALSDDGSAGIRGKVEKQTDKKVLKAVGESVLSVGSLFLGGRSRDPFNLEDQLRLNLAQNLGNEARQDLRNVPVEKSITVEADTPIQVILLEAV